MSSSCNHQIQALLSIPFFSYKRCCVGKRAIFQCLLCDLSLYLGKSYYIQIYSTQVSFLVHPPFNRLIYEEYNRYVSMECKMPKRFVTIYLPCLPEESVATLKWKGGRELKVNSGHSFVFCSLVIWRQWQFQTLRFKETVSPRK